MTERNSCLWTGYSPIPGSVLTELSLKCAFFLFALGHSRLSPETHRSAALAALEMGNTTDSHL